MANNQTNFLVDLRGNIFSKHTLLLLLIFAFVTGNAQPPNQKDLALQKSFSEALEECDGQKLFSVMRSEETKDVTPAQLQQFLDLVVEEWVNGVSIVGYEDGGLLDWKDVENPAMIQFKPTGGKKVVLVENRQWLFSTPTIEQNGHLVSTVGMAQIMFCVASFQANNPKLNQILEMEATQVIVENWILQLEKIGIKGSFNPEKKRWNTWKEIAAEGRAEIAKLKG